MPHRTVENQGENPREDFAVCVNFFHEYLRGVFGPAASSYSTSASCSCSLCIVCGKRLVYDFCASCKFCKMNFPAAAAEFPCSRGAWWIFIEITKVAAASNWIVLPTWDTLLHLSPSLSSSLPLPFCCWQIVINLTRGLQWRRTLNLITSFNLCPQIGFRMLSAITQTHRQIGQNSHLIVGRLKSRLARVSCV